jgi:hypothetical protein
VDRLIHALDDARAFREPCLDRIGRARAVRLADDARGDDALVAVQVFDERRQRGLLPWRFGGDLLARFAEPIEAG